MLLRQPQQSGGVQVQVAARLGAFFEEFLHCLVHHFLQARPGEVDLLVGGHALAGGLMPIHLSLDFLGARHAGWLHLGVWDFGRRRLGTQR